MPFKTAAMLLPYLAGPIFVRLCLFLVMLSASHRTSTMNLLLPKSARSGQKNKWEILLKTKISKKSLDYGIANPLVFFQGPII